jgi:hypothetical protein
MVRCAIATRSPGVVAPRACASVSVHGAGGVVTLAGGEGFAGPGSTVASPAGGRDGVGRSSGSGRSTLRAPHGPCDGVGMTGPVLLVTSPGAAAYDLGDGHPMRAVRTALTHDLADQLGVLARPAWSTMTAGPARVEDLLAVHTETYVAMVQAADRVPASMLAHFGLGTDDTPVIPALHEAA